MYYNQTVLDKEGWTAPTTVAELESLCQAAKAKGYDPPIAFSNNPGWEGFHQFSMTANDMIGPDAMRAMLYQNQGSWNTPEIVKAIQTYFVDLKNAGCYTTDANALEYNDGNSLFYTEQSILNTTGSWLVSEIRTNMTDQDVEFAPFPAIDGAKGQYWISGVGSAWYISAKSAHQDEAASLLDYFFQPDTIKQWIQKAGFSSRSRSIPPPWMSPRSTSRSSTCCKPASVRMRPRSSATTSTCWRPRNSTMRCRTDSKQ